MRAAECVSRETDSQTGMGQMHRSISVEHTVRLLAAAVIAVTFSACVSAASAAKPTPDTPTPTATAAPTSAADPLDSVTTVVARPESLELHDASGTVASLDYRSDVAAAIATMTTVFGTAPADEEYPAVGADAPGTAHRWGGFELLEPRYVDQPVDAAPTPFSPTFRVAFTAATSGDVELTTVEGHGVGDVWADFAASSGVNANGLCPELYVETVVLPLTFSDGTVRDRALSVEFLASDDGSVIGSVAGPWQVHPDGCA